MAGQRWEYKIDLVGDLGTAREPERREAMTKRLNDYGMDGWELVSVSIAPSGTTEGLFTLVFKRPVEAAIPEGGYTASDREG
jgi:hypothetical protein